MHELSIAQALVEQVEQVVAAEGAARATKVMIAVGALSGADPEALRSAFPLVAEGTTAEGAELIVEWVPVRVRCLECGSEFVADDGFMGCAVCASREVEWLSGRELHIQSIEVETDERQVSDV